MFKLSPRMQLIYDHLIPGKPVWDLCCDHGYMGLNAVESGHFPSVHFVDRVGPIIAQLKSRFQEHQERAGTSSTPAFFFALAAEDLVIPVEGTVVIAGVGGGTIEKILRGLAQRRLLKADRLLLCPQRGGEKLALDLEKIPDFPYQISNEDCKIEERGRIRKLLILNKK